MGVKIWHEYLLQIIRPRKGQFKSAAERFDLVVKACKYRVFVVLFPSLSLVFTCSVVCRLEIRFEIQRHTDQAHEGPEHYFLLQNPACSHCKNVLRRGCSMCCILHRTWNRGSHGRTRLSQPPMNLCAPNLQDTVLKPLSRDNEAVGFGPCCAVDGASA